MAKRENQSLLPVSLPTCVRGKQRHAAALPMADAGNAFPPLGPKSGASILWESERGVDKKFFLFAFRSIAI